MEQLLKIEKFLMKGGNKKREVKMVVNREEVYTIKQLIASMWEKWCNPEKEISHLKPSYASIRDEDIKWKMIDFVNCSGRINFFFWRYKGKCSYD